MSRIHCRNCYYWLPLSDEIGMGYPDDKGECRRRAPVGEVSGTMVPRLDTLQTVWPVTDDCNWCGEGVYDER